MTRTSGAAIAGHAHATPDGSGGAGVWVGNGTETASLGSGAGVREGNGLPGGTATVTNPDDGEGPPAHARTTLVTSPSTTNDRPTNGDGAFGRIDRLVTRTSCAGRVSLSRGTD